MLSQLIRLASLLCCAFVIVSFALFAIAQSSHASNRQAKEVVTGNSGASAGTSAGIAHEHQPRRFIDQVAEKLNSPWAHIVSSDNAWVEHIVPTAVSLLAYGLALGFIARLAAVRR